MNFKADNDKAEVRENNFLLETENIISNFDCLNHISDKQSDKVLNREVQNDLIYSICCSILVFIRLFFKNVMNS
jgi:hypothetical protein